QMTEQKLFFVSFKNGELSVQEVPEGIVEVSVLEQKESSIEYLYKKEKEHGDIFDSFLVAEECKREDRWKTQRIRNIPRKRKEAALLLSFLAEKEFQFGLEAAKDIHEEEDKSYLKIPYGINLFVTEENSCYLKLFDLTDTRIKKVHMSSFDIAKMNLKNTTIEELFLFDEAAVDFFYNSMGRSELCVEKVSFGNKLNPKSENILELIRRVHEGETTAPRKIKTLVFGKGSFFDFIKEASEIPKGKIHVDDLLVTQKGRESGPKIETSTRIVVSKKISIKGNARVLLFIELAPEISHFDICEIQRLCRSPRIDIQKINIQLTNNKIVIKENMHALQFLKKNITAIEMGFFATSRKNALKNTKLTLAAGEMESIWFRSKGLSVLLSLTNKKINTGYMTVMDTVNCLSNEEKEEIRGKEFVIREKLYMRNTGILFMEFLGRTVFIPVIEVEIDCCTEDWGGFKKTIGVNVETNALLEKISPGIKGARVMKQNIGEMITQKEPVVK
ncbi:MAG: uncharacterized protein A8A55_2115, partial [Amphiamblys sp. WSBS2006]